MMYTKKEENIVRALEEAFWQNVDTALLRSRNLITQRSDSYDNDSPFWHRYSNWSNHSHMLKMKAARVNSQIEPDPSKCVDNLLDLIAYAALTYATIQLFEDESEEEDDDEQEELDAGQVGPLPHPWPSPDECEWVVV